MQSGDNVKSIQGQIKSLIERIDGLSSMIKMARNSNVQLREIVGVHLEAMKRFRTPTEELIAQLPSVKSIIEGQLSFYVQPFIFLH